MSHLFLTFRRAVLGLSLTLALVAAAVPARADDPPKFKDPEVTAFFQKVSDTLEALLVAVKAKDDAKVKEFNAKLETLMKDGEPMQAKATLDEYEAARAWFVTRVKQLTDAGFVLPQ